MKIFDFLRRRDTAPRRAPQASDEALRESAALAALRPRVERAARERDRLLGENNYTARIRALYQEGRA